MLKKKERSDFNMVDFHHPVTLVEAEHLPADMRLLMDNADPVTPRLEAFWGESMALRVLSSRLSGATFSRTIVLQGRATGQPVEWAAIDFDLQVLPEEVIQPVLDGVNSFGILMRDAGMTFLNQPEQFFWCEAPADIARELGVTEGHRLYGRKARLWLGTGGMCGEAIELFVSPCSDA